MTRIGKTARVPSDAYAVQLHRVAELLTLVLPSAHVTRAGDAATLVDLARRHRVTGELRSYARRVGDQELASMLDHIERDRRLGLMANARAIAKVTAVLLDAQIPHVFLKGLGIALLTRQNLQDRSTQDVDVLVRPTDLRVVRSILEHHGAIEAPGYPPIDASWMSRAFFALRGEMTLLTAGKKIDLHWHSGPDPTVYPSAETAIASSVAVSVFGITFRTLDPATALWHSALHLRGDEYRQLRHVLDVHALAAGVPEYVLSMPAVASRSIAAVEALAANPEALSRTSVPVAAPSREWGWLRTGLAREDLDYGPRLRARAAARLILRPTSVSMAMRTPAAIAVGPLARWRMR